MPIYEYLCEDCGKITESLQKVSDPPPRRCGECGGKHLAKLVSRSAFQLKGGGWYSDLYASAKKTPEPAAPAGGDGAAKAPAKADAGAKAEAGAKPAKADKAAKSEGAGK